jgi:hypothetical protein
VHGGQSGREQNLLVAAISRWVPALDEAKDMCSFSIGHGLPWLSCTASDIPKHDANMDCGESDVWLEYGRVGPLTYTQLGNPKRRSRLANSDAVVLAQAVAETCLPWSKLKYINGNPRIVYVDVEGSTGLQGIQGVD